MLLSPPKQHTARLRGIDISYVEWNQKRDGPTILLAHATGFHARCWDGVVRELPDDCHIIALDHRGHGRSSKIGPYEWSVLDRDLCEFIRRCGLTDIVGVGHSMGGHCMVYSASQEPNRFRRLVLVDPVIMSPDAYDHDLPQQLYAAVEDHPVARRFDQWQSVDEMFERFQGRHPYRLWQKDVLWEYCLYGLEPVGSDEAQGRKYKLRCPPIVEASIYMGRGESSEIHSLLKSIEVPVTVLRAKVRDSRTKGMDFASSPTWPKLAANFLQGKDVYQPHLSHFMPMQDTALVARHIIEG